jgi:hypothetical protein
MAEKKPLEITYSLMGEGVMKDDSLDVIREGRNVGGDGSKHARSRCWHGGQDDIMHRCLLLSGQSVLPSTDMAPTSSALPQLSTGPSPVLAGSLQEAQINALLTLLNLNEPPTHLNLPGSSAVAAPGANSKDANKPVDGSPFDQSQQGPLVWKVLVLDEQSKDILATCLRVQDLREQGVTLHM